jgi:hypothetical protein
VSTRAQLLADLAIRAKQIVARCTLKADTGCLEWTGAMGGTTKRPTVSFRGATHYAARIILANFLGRPLRRGMVAAHTCDNKKCLNELHLEEATESKNLTDAWRRGRRNQRPMLLSEDHV